MIAAYLKKTSPVKHYLPVPFLWKTSTNIPLYLPKYLRTQWVNPHEHKWVSFLSVEDSTMDIGSIWVKDNTSAVLSVPSVIIPGENNFLLNINHPNFKKIKIGQPEKFIFDRRMEK